MEHPEVVEVHAVRGFQVSSIFLFWTSLLIAINAVEVCRGSAQKTDQSNGIGGRCISILVTGWLYTIAYGAWTLGFST
jgi:divalent metal cation (Fe/Co/Zn/Cd) transporter